MNGLEIVIIYLRLFRWLFSEHVDFENKNKLC